jgi:hypothetical protein
VEEDTFREEGILEQVIDVEDQKQLVKMKKNTNIEIIELHVKKSALIIKQKPS